MIKVCNGSVDWLMEKIDCLLRYRLVLFIVVYILRVFFVYILFLEYGLIDYILICESDKNILLINNWY